jgi:polyhydroxybutyrate depolymerase
MNHPCRTSQRGIIPTCLFGVLALACSRSEHAVVAELSKNGDASATSGDTSMNPPGVSCVLRGQTPLDRADARTTAGCGRQAQTGSLRRKTTDGAGNAREFELLVPASYDSSKPLAVTFVYHGSGGNEDVAKSYGLQNAPGAADASIFVFPRGIPFESYGVGWNDKCSGYDMPLFDHMLDDVSQNFCIDPSRVFATGFSWGGDHVTALACCRGSLVRAIAPASGTDEFTDPSNYCTYQNAPCPNAGSTAVRFTFDRGGDGPLTAQQYQATTELFRGLGHCTASSTAGSKPCVTFEGCSQPYVECGYSGLGHALPTGWANDTWQFFASF